MMCMRLHDPPQMRRVRQSVGSRNIPRPKREFKVITVFPRTLRNKGKSQYALKGVCKFVLCAGDTDCGLVQRSLLFWLPGWSTAAPAQSRTQHATCRNVALKRPKRHGFG